MYDRPQEASVRHATGWGLNGQNARQPKTREHHDDSRDPEHGSPAERGRHSVCDGPREHDPRQQPAHDITGHSTTLTGFHEMRGERQQDLRSNGTQADGDGKQHECRD